MIKRMLLSTGAGAAVLAATLCGALAQTKTYPPGTDCASQPTIAERLLCGRQEFRRQSGASFEPSSPAPDPSRDDGVQRVMPLSPHADEIAPPVLPRSVPSRTASPNH
jgi:hypothetical protein